MQLNNKHEVFVSVLLFLGVFLFGQKDPIEADILYSYYEQDGDHAAVTGGIGSQELENHAPMVILKVPLTKDSHLRINTGIDAYTSASSGNIDKYTSGASSSEDKALSAKDTRKHIDVKYAESFANSKRELTLSAGYSTEYDVESINAGLGFNIKSRDNNHSVSLLVKGYLDQWLLIYPGEIRNGGFGYHDDDHEDYDDKSSQAKNNNSTTEEDFNTDNRYTYNLGLVYEGIINKKTNFAVLFDYTNQSGLLITPFHRVYFDDGIESIRRKVVRVESLPSNRNKFAVGLRLNHFLSQIITTRLYYRFYRDDFGILSHTLSAEVPVRLSKSISVAPSIRYYQQTASDYFAPYAEHDLSSIYYTSDYDLSDFYSLNSALAFKYAPLGGVFNINVSGKPTIELRKIELRYAYYQRLDGLKANNISIGTKFIFH